ncbi:hypothetical protein DPMN_109815 [Dreissena polymorpha]|uniref:Uncharacterized protein n=1 Tax=Dreissena polymorpha TaxID=45954 RepID=A0A9D4QNE0_DREPO|nr:hypothetical protein DPMN_109815 [Dreissena polymorpha]
MDGLGYMNDNGESFADLCATSNLVIGESVSIIEGYTRQLGCHQTYQRRTRLTICASQGSFVALFRMCQARSRRSFGPSSHCRPIETKAEEELVRGAQPTPTLQHCHTERHLEAKRVHGHSFQQVPGPRGAA